MPSDDQPVSLTARLANFLAGSSGEVEPGLLHRATSCVLDTIGAIVFGADQEWSRIAAGHALTTGGPGPATIVGHRQATSPAMAAFANGCAAHAFELDDVHEEAISHPGAVVVPAALAVAEQLGASGHDLLEAVVIGYEAMGRAGIAVGPASHMLGGFHPTSMSGVFGSAAAAGRLLGLDAARLNHAFGLAASLASGTMEFAASGGMAKRVHAGRAAEGGITAAMLAAGGLEGSADGLAGRYGFCRVFTHEPCVELLVEQLGGRWMIDEITVKPYAACSDIHPMIQAAIELRDEHGLTADMITRIDAEGPTKAAEQNSLDGTVSVMAAQYSAQFNIAAALVADPTDPGIYAPDRITDPAIAELQAKVASVSAHPEFDETYAWKMGGRVRIALATGEVVERTVKGQKGSMHSPLTADEVRAKFDGLVAGRASSALASVISTLADRPVSDLTTELMASGPADATRHLRSTDGLRHPGGPR